MKEKKILSTSGVLLTTREMEEYLEKLGATQTLTNKSNKETYPIPRLLDNYLAIKNVYEILNEHVKLGIAIHPAGEWILDNFYIIEETVKSIKQNLNVKKYKNFIGIKNGPNSGFARIYVLASEIVNYTDNKIETKNLEKYLTAYQTKKSLNMDEIWDIGIFIQISIIENIRQICERIYISQIEKYKVESIIESLVDEKNSKNFKTIRLSKNLKMFSNMKYPFIEYMSYKLKTYGKKTEKYLEILEEIVEKTGTSVSDIIKKEHFDIAIRRVSIGNCINSIKRIQRINFLELFEKINGVEEILKQDPANVYSKMDYTTKDNYRQAIKEIAHKTKVSEIYIAKKLLELSKGKKGKESHIGYYLSNGNRQIIYDKIGYKIPKILSKEQKAKYYVTMVVISTVILAIIFAWRISFYKLPKIFNILAFLFTLIPISEFVVQVLQYFLSKFVKPNYIPKLNMYNGIDEENATMVVIPTILKNKEKVEELTKKLEVFYLANKSKNLYFCLLGDCTESKNKEEKWDKEIIEEGLKQIKILNDKYSKKNSEKLESVQRNETMSIFNFAYRKRKWNEKQNSYLGWERKRGALTEFVEFLLGKMSKEEIQNSYYINTIAEDFVHLGTDLKQKGPSPNEKDRPQTKRTVPKVKYLITLDSDTDLILNSAYELVGAMAHILNRPEVENGKVVNGYGLIQPRVGVNMDISYKNMFTKIFAGSGGIDSYTNAISDIYQDNFDEGIFTGKGIFDLNMYSKILKDEIPDNTVLSHDLLEGCYLRCGLASDIMIMDGYPTKYASFMQRLSRWIRGDWQILGWIKSKKLNVLSKFKIIDNLRRSVFEISIFVALIYFWIIGSLFKVNVLGFLIGIGAISILPFLLEIINLIIFKKEGEHKQDSFLPKVTGGIGAILRAVLTFGCMPYKAFISFKSIMISLYRMFILKKNLLEWTTSEEAEKVAKDDIFSYYKNMYINVIARNN